MNELAFICHSSEDSAIADKIVSRLEKIEIDCWIAPRNVDFGSTYAASIVQGIKKSTHFIFIYTKSSNESEAVIKEIEKADSLKIRIIPFKIEDIEYNDSLEYYLRSKQSVIAFNKTLDNAIDELTNYIKQLQPPSLLPPKPRRFNRKRAIILITFVTALIITSLIANNLFKQTIDKPPDQVLDIENGKVVIYDKFRDNSNNWDIGKKDVFIKTFENSMYSLENIENISFTSSRQKVNINSDSDFLIETTVRIVKNVEWTAGIVWSSDLSTGLSSQYTFHIYPRSKLYDFRYTEGYLKNNNKYASSKIVIDGKHSDAIKTDNEWNKISIIRSKDIIRFYINGEYIDEVPYVGFKISTVGIVISGKLKAEFKQFKLKVN